MKHEFVFLCDHACEELGGVCASCNHFPPQTLHLTPPKNSKRGSSTRYSVPSHIAITPGLIPYLSGVGALCWLDHMLGYGVMLANNLDLHQCKFLIPGAPTTTNDTNETAEHAVQSPKIIKYMK